MGDYLPYFWDYKLTASDLRAIFASKNPIKKRWALARLVESAPLEEIWKYITLDELRQEFPHLKLKQPVRRVWEKALKVRSLALS